MKAILTLLCAIGASSMFGNLDNKIFDFNSDFDIIGSLPLEVAIIIFRLLDPKSHVRAITVRRSWFRIIKSDWILRQKVRQQLRKERNETKGLLIYAPVISRSGSSEGMYRPVNVIRPTFQNQRIVEMPLRNLTKKTKGQKRKLEATENPLPKKNAAASRVNL